MSTYVEEKLARVEEAYGTKARAKFHHLKARWGSKGIAHETRAPMRVEIESHLGVEIEVWRRVDQSTGQDAVYELEETRRVNNG